MPATEDQRKTIREAINDTTTPYKFDDDRIDAAYDAAGTVSGASASLWRVKASQYAELVDVAEGTSRRSLGDLYEQALKMAGIYDATTPDNEIPDTRRPARLRPIVRP